MARNLVLRQLTMRACSRQELADMLRRRQVPAEAAEAVLNRMTEVGLIDDDAFANSWVESRQQRRYLSKAVLRRELRGKGIDHDQVEEALEQVTGDDEYAAARALAEKRRRALKDLDARVQRRRIAGALARRGFGAAVVSRVLEDLDADPAEGEFGDDGEALGLDD